MANKHYLPKISEILAHEQVKAELLVTFWVVPPETMPIDVVSGYWITCGG